MSSKTNSDTKRMKVAVVGAGGAGLMCTHQLLKRGVVNLEDIVILEARDRVGGRIHTTIETMTPISDSKSSSSADDKISPVNVYRDHGAAWVHGTGFDWPNFSPEEMTTTDAADQKKVTEEGPVTNPMMGLLQQATPEGENVCLTHLEPTFKRGNPWMRPGHVLTPKEMVLFVDGVQIGGDAGEERAKQDDTIFSEALKRHYNIMNQVGQIGYDLIVSGRTQETVEQSFQQALDRVLARSEDNSATSSAGDYQSYSMDTTDLVVSFYRHLIECWHGSSTSGLQLHEFSTHVQGDKEGGELLDEQYTDEGDFYGPHCTMKKGMQTVLDPLLETASPCIRLNEPVCDIRLQASNDTEADDVVRLETSSGSVVEADYCVITVPLGCLAESLRGETSNNRDPTLVEAKTGTICFEPRLSADKVQAIQHMNMGCYKKVFLTFDRIFWPTKEAFVGLVRSRRESAKSLNSTDDGLGNHMLLDNLWARNGIPSIEAVLIGNAGNWATGKPDKVICSAVLNFLADAMDLDDAAQLQTWCVDCHVTRWEEDPYSRGAYSGYRLGTTEMHTRGLATSEWDGRLVFAGEATLSGYEGSVHAALISGETAAKEIEAAMQDSVDA